MAAPATIDLRLVRYSTTAVLDDGTQVDLGPHITKALREEVDDSFSQSLHLTLIDAVAPDGRSLSEVVALGVKVVHVASYDEGATWDTAAPFEAEVMSWKPADSAGTFEVVAYVPLQLLQGEMAKIHAFYPAGKAGAEVLADVFAQFGIPVGRIDGPTVTMPKILFSGKAGELVLKVLQHALAMGDKCYLPRWQDGAVGVRVPGANDPIRVFDGTQNVTAAAESRDTLDQVDQATVLGAAADPADPARTTLAEVAQVTVNANDETVVGVRPLTSYTDPSHAPPPKYAKRKPPPKHHRKTTVRNPNADTPKLAKDAAKVIVASMSVPSVTRTFTLFNADDVRKGDVVFVRAGRCNDYQTLLSASHDLDARTLAVKTAARGTPLYKAQRMDVTRQALAGTGGPSSNAAGLQSLFAWCRAHLGIPYEWGAKGPNTYDCSGFTSAAFREACGVEIGGSTAAQWDQNPPGDGSPGDLVLFGFASFPGGITSEHVGIVSEDPSMMYDEPGPTSGLHGIAADAAFESRGIKGYRRPVDFSGAASSAQGTGAGAAASPASPPSQPQLQSDFLAHAPPMLADAIRRYFPESEWENAAAISYHETGGWTDFVTEKPNGSGPGTLPEMSYGWFQVNALAHGGTKDYWMDTDNNVGFAWGHWLAHGWCQDWVRSAQALGLCG